MALYAMETPSFYRRLAAWFIDVVLLFSIVQILNWWSFNVTILTPKRMLILPLEPGYRNFILACLWVQICYFGLFHGLMGRTPGKTLLCLRVVDISGSGPSQGQIFLRSILFPGLFFFPLLVGPYIIGVVNDWVIAVTLVLLYLWQLLDFIMTPFDFRAQRSLHDLVASTRVVMD